ncbi:MAG: tRNA (N6-threonylcarbamoyladenosine(37)-N6)-methyltransferase TrmO [Alphaproteobacteria bacterium]|nr:tRNA (N6-threonylcarbamoyladenosine(37)-N6)-methyltransferase TrmO [Alphaproteobacteria bacterium]
MADPPVSDRLPPLRPIGRIETPFKTLADCPRNGRQLDPAPQCRAIVLPEFVAGLAGVEGFSHLILIYALHQAGPPDLVFTPPFDGTPRGVFATRAPRRPNPLGLSVVAFDGFAAEGVLKVRYLDCLDGTPLLDIKPYLRSTDCEPDATMGWLEKHRTR